MIRQGDVMLIEVVSLPPKVSVVPRDPYGRCVLALGEATGHAHVVTTPLGVPSSEVTLVTDSQERRFLRLMADAELVHEEHGTIPLKAGLYQQIQQHEWEDGMGLPEPTAPTGRPRQVWD